MILLIGCRPVPVADTADTAASSDAVLALPALDGDLHPLLVDAISGATRRIDVAQYTLYDSGAITPLIDALIDAAGRGIPVRVLADEAGSGTAAALSRLSAGGVDARLDSPAVTTHTKLLIADDHAFVEALWSDPATDPGLSWSGTGPLTPLSDRRVYPALSDCIDTATGRIRVVMYAIADNPDYPDSEVADLVDGLIAARGRGVDVGVILDASDWIVDNNINDHAIGRLLAGEVTVLRTPASVTTHAKVLLCDDRAIISDANWSYSALTAYHGVSAQTDDADIAADVLAWWQALEAQSEAVQ